MSLYILLLRIPRNYSVRLVEVGGLVSCWGRHRGKAHASMQSEEIRDTCNKNFSVFCCRRLLNSFSK